MDIFLNSIFMDEPVWLWLVFGSIVTILLAFDLGVLHRDDHEIGVKESLKLSGFYIVIALLFGLFIFWRLGNEEAMEYYTGYIIEKSLSMDNIFVMALIFSALSIPRAYQHRVLFWGILGVILLRGLMIGVGSTLVHQFEWVLYIFAAFLIFTGFKLLFMKDAEDDHSDKIQNNPITAYLRRHFKITDRLHGHNFFVRLPDASGEKVLFMTPLFLALVTIEFADLIFAVDSVPAIFAITTNTYIVFTSNIFAILGLRALYFALSAMIERFAYLKYALALILIFIGSKVFLVDFFNMEKFPAALSLGVTLALLAGGMVFSLYKTKDMPITDKNPL